MVCRSSITLLNYVRYFYLGVIPRPSQCQGRAHINSRSTTHGSQMQCHYKRCLAETPMAPNLFSTRSSNPIPKLFISQRLIWFQVVKLIFPSHGTTIPPESIPNLQNFSVYWTSPLPCESRSKQRQLIETYLMELLSSWNTTAVQTCFLFQIFLKDHKRYVQCFLSS